MKTYRSWIQLIPYEEATGKLKLLYDRIKGPNNYIDNIMMVHSLRPHSMEGHMAIYKNVLHHSGNKLPRWLLETVGIYVSLLNGCGYCVEHHYQGLRRLLKDDGRAQAIRSALEQNQPDGVFSSCELAILRYAQTLTQSPTEMSESLLQAMRSAGLDDGEILEVNQVVSYFAYANRTVLGLGVTTKGDILGLAPSEAEDAEDWHHH
jgi:uncharacterized peroxidase-related enzyme